MTCAPGISVANTAVPEASAAFSMRTSAGAPSATTMATGWTANRLPSIWNSSASPNAARWAISWLPRTWMRLGWMRLRCPTSAATPVLSRQSLVAPPAFPPSQANPSLSRLSSYSCATLICNMGLPGGDVLMERARVGVGRELAAQLAVAQHLRELRQDSKVLFGRLLGHQQHENEIDGLAVGGVEGHGLSEAHKSADRLLQALDPAVRNRDPLAQAGRAEALPGEQTVEYQTSRHALIVLEEEPRLLEHALLARHIQLQKDVGRGQKLRNKVHRGLCRIGRFCTVLDEPYCEAFAPFQHPSGPGCDEQEARVRAGGAPLREQSGRGEKSGIRQSVHPGAPRLDQPGPGGRDSSRQDQGPEGGGRRFCAPRSSRALRRPRRQARQSRFRAAGARAGDRTTP